MSQTPYDKLAYLKDRHLRAPTVATSTPLSKDQIYMLRIRDHKSIPANYNDSDDSLGNLDSDPKLSDIPHNDSVDPMSVINITDKATESNTSNSYAPEISDPLKIKFTDFFF